MLKNIGQKSKRESYRIEHDKQVEKIIIALSGLGMGRFWSQPTGAAYRKGELIRYGLVGCADISGILFGGKRVEIEVKTGKAKQSAEQIFFGQMIKMFGGIYFVAHSAEEAVSYLKSVATSS